LLTHGGCQVEEDLGLRMEGVWGMATDVCTVFHWNPRNGKSVEGMRLDFAQWMMKPALIRRCRASIVFSRQMVYVKPRIRMSLM
jgi:hypothetical protein